MDISEKKLKAVIEAILFVAGEPIKTDTLAHALDLTVSELSPVLDSLRDEYDLDERGLRLNRFGESVQLATRPEYAPFIERVLQPVQKQSLSQAAMETLSIVAYRQPVTKGEIEAIRGVKCDYSIQSLLAKGLIEEAGRRETLGRPVLYRTAEKFLMHFGIESLAELPEVDIPAQNKEKR